MKTLIIIFFLFLNVIYAQEKNSENVIYEYKKYESFDLGSLEVKGNILAPGDLTVEERKRKVFYQDLFTRESFKKEIKEDIRDLR